MLGVLRLRNTENIAEPLYFILQAERARLIPLQASSTAFSVATGFSFAPTLSAFGCCVYEAEPLHLKLRPERCSDSA